jgi:hypothetical protein
LELERRGQCVVAVENSEHSEHSSSIDDALFISAWQAKREHDARQAKSPPAPVAPASLPAWPGLASHDTGLPPTISRSLTPILPYPYPSPLFIFTHSRNNISLHQTPILLPTPNWTPKGLLLLSVCIACQAVCTCPFRVVSIWYLLTTHCVDPSRQVLRPHNNIRTDLQQRWVIVIHTDCRCMKDNDNNAWVSHESISGNSTNWICTQRANDLLRHRTMQGVYRVGVDQLDRGCQGTRVHRMWCKRGARRKFPTVGWR